MARRKTERTQMLAKPTAPEMSQGYEALVTAIAQSHDHAQRQAVQAINVALTLRNWLTGYYIVEYALGGMSNQVFVFRYLLSLPAKEELAAFVR